MYDTKKSLINQLSFVHLNECLVISKKLLILDNLIKLNNNFLKFRKKI